MSERGQRIEEILILTDDDWAQLKPDYRESHGITFIDTHYAAATIIGHYWLGEAVDPHQLRYRLMSEPDLFDEASLYAVGLTDPNTDEREFVDLSRRTLWETRRLPKQMLPPIDFDQT